MYPVLRAARQAFVHRNGPPMGLFDTHSGRHVVWPVDIDPWRELNNGRTLTLYDLGRVAVLQRTGLFAAMRGRGWAGTVAGATVRYRRRVQMFHRVEMRSRILGWDAKFLYMEQAMLRERTCTSHALFRIAVTDRTRLVPTAEVAPALGAGDSPALPDWVRAWSEAEDRRPWPPMGAAN